MSTHAILYDADGSDKEIALDDAVSKPLADSMLLWIDLSDPTKPEALKVLNAFAITPEALTREEKRPTLRQFDGYFCMHALSIGLEGELPTTEPVTFLVGSNFVVTIHPPSVRMFDEFVNQNQGETRLGEMSSVAFFASLLDWFLARYFSATEVLEDSIDELDLQALGVEFNHEFLDDLAKIRRQVARVRRLLVSHRGVFHALARPDFAKAAAVAAPPHLKLLAERFERAVDAVEVTRDLVMSAYELFSTGMSQRINETMRRLTFFTVLLGIIAVVAAVLGMSFQASIFATGDSGFIVSLATMAVFSIVAIVFGRRRGWL